MSSLGKIIQLIKSEDETNSRLGIQLLIGHYGGFESFTLADNRIYKIYNEKIGPDVWWNSFEEKGIRNLWRFQFDVHDSFCGNGYLPCDIDIIHNNTRYSDIIIQRGSICEKEDFTTHYGYKHLINNK